MHACTYHERADECRYGDKSTYPTAKEPKDSHSYDSEDQEIMSMGRF